MKRAVVASLLVVSMVGCFPHNARNRTYAKIGEGTAILAGIAISAVANTGADCDSMDVPGVNNTSCHTKAEWASTAGIVLIVGGLLGFVATVSTAEPDEQPKVIEIKDVTHKPEEPKVTAPALTPKSTPTTNNTQATDPNDSAGSGSSAPSAPQR